MQVTPLSEKMLVKHSRSKHQGFVLLEGNDPMSENRQEYPPQKFNIALEILPSLKRNVDHVVLQLPTIIFQGPTVKLLVCHLIGLVATYLSKYAKELPRRVKVGLFKYKWVVVSNMLYFHPNLGKRSNLTNIFQWGLKPPTR